MHIYLHAIIPMHSYTYMQLDLCTINPEVEKCPLCERPDHGQTNDVLVEGVHEFSHP